MVKALANDVTVCGEVEPSAHVTEFFQGDGTTVLFDLTEDPWTPPPSKAKPLLDSFQGPTINTQIWNVNDPGAALVDSRPPALPAGAAAATSAPPCSLLFSDLELGGGLVIEAGGVQFGQNTSGIINGFFGAGMATLAACIAGFSDQPGKRRNHHRSADERNRWPGAVSQPVSRTFVYATVTFLCRTTCSGFCRLTTFSARKTGCSVLARICCQLRCEAWCSKCRTPRMASPELRSCSTRAASLHLRPPGACSLRSTPVICNAASAMSAWNSRGQNWVTSTPPNGTVRGSTAGNNRTGRGLHDRAHGKAALLSGQHAAGG
jgi:hypothetical protein